MPAVDFATAQGDLATARSEQVAATLAVAQAAAQQATVARAAQQLERAFDPQSEAARAERERLDELAKQAAAQSSAAGEQALRAQQSLAAALDGFAAFTDPRQNVTSLPDRSPMALFPVRLETRFVTVSDRTRGTGAAAGEGARGVPEGEPARAAAPREQLWVRIYPDDCSIDTFEPTLSVTELTAAQRYWRQIWSAGGLEDAERAAWGALVSAVGSGRAGWIVDNYSPVNVNKRPSKASADDEILVIVTQTPLDAAQATAIGAYWEAVWRAADDVAAQQVAQAALEAAVGAAQAAQLIAEYAPYNLADTPTPPASRSSVTVQSAFLVFGADPPATQQSWSTAPHVECFPDRFVLLGYEGGTQTLEAIGNVVELPLYVGPDPSADATTDPTHTIHPDGEDLFVPDELQWMVDFEQAVAAGMGIAVDLTPAQARQGFDRLLVLGLQLSASDADGKAALEDLLHHHAVGRAGLSLIPQGTPTHNTTGPPVGYTRLDDADESFDDRQNSPLFTTTTDPLQKRDGQWLAELVGIDPAALSAIHAAGGSDQRHARAMQHALWPATLGYWMDKLLSPVFGDDAVDATRWFFTEFVSGRGSVPAIQIGGQPYGILPTTAFSRIRWLDPRPRGTASINGRRPFLARLLGVLRTIDADWTAMSASAAYVGKADDPHQTLLDIVGLHPSSVEYHSRYAESLDELFNITNLWGLGPDFLQALEQLGLEAAGEQLLARLGYAGVQPPEILKHFFLRDAGQITTVIDDRPLSETDPIRAYTDSGENYITWLIAAAQSSLDALRLEQGFTGGVSPQALLYLYLRHALMLGYYDTSYQLHKSAGFLSATELESFKPEPLFVHVAEAAGASASASESRFAALYKTEPRITSSAGLLVGDYITANFSSLREAAGLADQLAALRVLADAPTAALERVFAEHVDTCCYRFDSWLLGLVNLQLQSMRYGGGEAVADGVYVGAYAWLEDLRPAAAQLAPVQLPAELEASFGGPTPLRSDPANGGYIHAPSLPHARTAAVLRSGYLANASAANPQTMAVDLSSDRVRLALSLLEGIRNGQSLGALLGYRFERGLHDDYPTVEVDSFIYPLRKAFPLVADSLDSTKTLPDVPIEAIEASNVVDGRKLIDQVQATGVATYPFGLPAGTLPPASPDEANAINAQVSALLDVYDAVADLALAEGVHQAVQGNFERIASTLDAYSSGNFPPDPDVVKTPPTGIGLTHRMAVHLKPGLAAPANSTPRATAEPAVDAWLGGVLPDLDRIACTVSYTDPVSRSGREQPVTLGDLGLRPIDLLDLVKAESGQAMSELDDRVMQFVYASAAPRPDAQLTIAYMTAPVGKFSIFQAAPLVRSLTTLVRGSRPLRPTDALLGGDATPERNAAVVVHRARIADPLADLQTLIGDIGTLLDALAPLLADTDTNLDAIVGGIDGFLDQAIALLERAARFGLPQSGWGFAYDWRRLAVAGLLDQVRDLTGRWDQRLADFDTQLAAYDALPPATADVDRFKALQTAELLVAARLDPLPADPVTLRSDLDGKRATFAARRDEFQALLTAVLPTFSDALAAVQGLLPVTDFDSQPFDLSDAQNGAVTLAQDLQRILAGQAAQAGDRRDGATQQLAVFDNAGTAAAQAQALLAAARALLGEQFVVVPEFTLEAGQASEWANAVTAGSTGNLLTYLKTTAAVDFPVEEWLCGAARVRPMVHAWEAAVALGEAFGGTEPELVPAQFPYEAEASWVAMQFPPDYVLDSNRLCYTAHYSTPFDQSANQCGLLLDDWTEVIPGTDRDTGITFNFDRPDNEPPQAILLVTPASATGSWEWDDLVGALNETLDLAKKRAVEPVQVDQTGYTRFLPATVTAATLYGISITTALAAANNVIANIEEARLA
ncbi:MAG TPA: hypothetical protein VGL51_02590 [Solirubrobacteraceae bacterium]